MPKLPVFKLAGEQGTVIKPIFSTTSEIGVPMSLGEGYIPDPNQIVDLGDKYVYLDIGEETLFFDQAGGEWLIGLIKKGLTEVYPKVKKTKK